MTGLTSPTERAAATIMGRRLNTLVPVRKATVAVVAEALPRALPAQSRQRCMNPNCQRMVERPAAGRLPFFCGRPCREASDYERDELLADVAVLEAALSAGGGTHAQRRAITVELSTRRWCLHRYMVTAEGGRAETGAE